MLSQQPFSFVVRPYPKIHHYLRLRNTVSAQPPSAFVQPYRIAYPIAVARGLAPLSMLLMSTWLLTEQAISATGKTQFPWPISFEVCQFYSLDAQFYDSAKICPFFLRLETCNYIYMFMIFAQSYFVLGFIIVLPINLDNARM